MHFGLAFAVPPNKSLMEREKEIDALFSGETNKYDGLRVMTFKDLHDAWEEPPYAYVDENNEWHEVDPEGTTGESGRDGAWRAKWIRAALSMSEGWQAVFVYADCHR